MNNGIDYMSTLVCIFGREDGIWKKDQTQYM